MLKSNAGSGKRTWQEKYRLAEPLIRQACATSGTPGLAIGIFNHEGKIFDKHLGHRDVYQKLSSNPETVFNIGSMCKGFTAVAVACIVTDGKLHWDDCIEKFIDELHGTNIGHFTIRDLLSHRSGLSRSDALFIGSDNQLLLSKAQGTSLLASLDTDNPPRQDFIYNNSVITHSLLRGLTTSKKLESINLDYDNLHKIFEATMPLKVATSLREQSYALGWARTQLPNQVSEITGNSGLLEDYPRLGSYENGPLLFHHSGNNIGCSSSVYLMPELDIGIVVLGNSLGHCDATDWACQILTETYLNHKTKIDFPFFFSSAASKGRSAMERVQDSLEREREPSEPPINLSVYKGFFWHASRQFYIQVLLNANGKLAMLLQGRNTEKYILRHYHRHTFLFNETFDQVVQRGQWCRPCWFYKIHFVWRDELVVALRWKIDDTQEEGCVFEKLD
ncbi:unnamed protein product [Fusarium graminearum]|nr:unnamed protein product [Fusarium graminearum]